MLLILDQQLWLLLITNLIEETRVLERRRGQYVLTVESQVTQLRSAIRSMAIHQDTSQGLGLQLIKLLLLPWGIMMAMHMAMHLYPLP